MLKTALTALNVVSNRSVPVHFRMTAGDMAVNFSKSVLRSAAATSSQREQALDIIGRTNEISRTFGTRPLKGIGASIRPRARVASSRKKLSIPLPRTRILTTKNEFIIPAAGNRDAFTIKKTLTERGIPSVIQQTGKGKDATFEVVIQKSQVTMELAKRMGAITTPVSPVFPEPKEKRSPRIETQIIPVPSRDLFIIPSKGRKDAENIQNTLLEQGIVSSIEKFGKKHTVVVRGSDVRGESTFRATRAPFTLRPFPKSLGRLGDQIVVNAVFHNKGKSTKVRALLDTGAEVTALSMSRAKKIGVRFGGPVILRGAGGRATVRMGRIESVSIPGTGCEVGPLDVILFDQRAFPLGGLTGLQSIIGFDFMKKAKMQIAAFKRTRVAKCQI
jgi:hypothetical protein